MKKQIILAQILIMYMATTLFCIAQEANSIDTKIIYTSNYIWRDNVSNYQAIQPIVAYTLEDIGLLFQLETSIGITKRSGNIEVNPSVTYSYSVNKSLELSSGVVGYFSGNLPGNNDYFEFFQSMLMPTLFLSPEVTMYYSYTNSIYGTIYFEQTISVSKNFEPLIYGSLEFRIGDFQQSDGVSALVFGVRKPIHIFKNVLWLDTGLAYLPDITQKKLNCSIKAVYKL